MFFLHPVVERTQAAVNVFDAAGLGLFCVAGATKAYDYGLGLTSSAVLGLATAVGGGVLRDVLASEVPSLLRWDRDLYAVPAIVGATMVVLFIRFEMLNPLSPAAWPRSPPASLRLLALRYRWRAPRAGTAGRRPPKNLPLAKLPLSIFLLYGAVAGQPVRPRPPR